MNKVRLILILLCVVIISCGTSNDSNNDNGSNNDNMVTEHKILKFSGAYDPVMRCVTLDWTLNPEWLTEQPGITNWLDGRVPIPEYTVYRSDGARRDTMDTRFINCSNDLYGWDFDHLPYDYNYSYDVGTCFIVDGSGVCAAPENGLTVHITPVPEELKVTGSYDPVSRCVTLELALNVEPLESASLPKYKIERWVYTNENGNSSTDMGHAETTNSSFTHCSDDEVLGFDVRDNKIVYPEPMQKYPFYYHIFASVDVYSPTTGEKVPRTYNLPYFLPDNIWSYPYMPDLSGTYPVSKAASAHDFTGVLFTAGNVPKSSLDTRIEKYLQLFYKPAPDAETLIFTTDVVEDGDNSTAYVYVKDKSFSYTVPTIVYNRSRTFTALNLGNLIAVPRTKDICRTGTYMIKDEFDDNGMYIGGSAGGRFDADCDFPSNINISKP